MGESSASDQRYIGKNIGKHTKWKEKQNMVWWKLQKSLRNKRQSAPDGDTESE